MLPKVRRCVPVLVGLALLAGCGPEPDVSDNPPRKAPVTVDDRFGDPYEIVLSRIPAAPAEPPALVDDSLLVHVAYSGGCADHAFALRHRTARDTTRLWLVHDANGDGCETYLYDDLGLPVSQDLLDAPVVVLLNPQGGPPHVLRWGSSEDRG